jgi:hypothetical protein
MKAMPLSPAPVPPAQCRTVSVIWLASSTTTILRASLMISATPKQIARAAQKRINQIFFTQASDQANRDAGKQEQTAHFDHPPSAQRNTPDHHRECDPKKNRNDLVQSGKRGGCICGASEMRLMLSFEVKDKRT